MVSERTVNMRKIILFAWILLIFGCSAKHNGVIVGIKYQSVSQLPISAALSTKALSKENVKYYSSYQSVVKALNKGKIDISVIPPDEIFKGKNKNIIILSSFIRGGYGILGYEKINSKADLQGKVVGVLKKSEGEFLAEQIADSLGIKLKKYSIKKLMKTDFIYGKISGMVLSVPEIVLESSLKYKIVYWFSDDLSYYPYADIAVNKNSYKNKKQELDTLIEHIVKIGDEFMGSPNLLFETAEKIFDTTYHRAKRISYQIRFINSDFNENKKFEKNLFEFMKKNNYIKNQNFNHLILK